jgi:hypothetical protein
MRQSAKCNRMELTRLRCGAGALGRSNLRHGAQRMLGSTRPGRSSWQKSWSLRLDHSVGGAHLSLIGSQGYLEGFRVDDASESCCNRVAQCWMEVVERGAARIGAR